MTQKSQLFAFIAGEVSEEFYGRRDLAKYPLALAEAENFLIDYRGGIFNRSGHEFIMALPEQEHRMTRFKTTDYDLVLFFTHRAMRVIRDGSFVLTGAIASGAVSPTGVVTAANSFAVGQSIFVTAGPVQGYFNIVAANATSFSVIDPFGGNPLVGQTLASAQRVYELVTPYPREHLAELRFFQDTKWLIITSTEHAAREVEYLADNSLTLSVIPQPIPVAPGAPTVVASGSGGASVAYRITAIVNGMESEPSPLTVMESVVNMTVTTGHMSLTWAAVPGATEYYVYRSLVFPSSPYPTGVELGYVGRTFGTVFQDSNVTGDFTKAPPNYNDFFSGNNYPSLYARFQQRGIYAGFSKDILGVVGSASGNRRLFPQNSPTQAVDSFRYEIDSQSATRIKHMLPLRYGLLLFNDEGITQLKGGGESTALTATSAIAEQQGYVSVADVEPVAINLDVLYVTELFTEVNAMVYTEYTNSFKVQDVAVLSSHLFGADHPVKRMLWVAEPHKLVKFLRGDGQIATLTYERNQDVYGWARQRTKGDYLDFTVIRESGHSINYYTILRRLNGKFLMTVERDKPRQSIGYNRMWFVDCGVQVGLTTPNVAGVLYRLGTEDSELPDWEFILEAPLPIPVDARLYIHNGLFRVEEVSGTKLTLRPMDPPEVSTYFQDDLTRVKSGQWEYGVPVDHVSGLWWLEGETVSILADGDAWVERVVTNGRVDFDGVGASIIVGLPYRSRAKTLPLGLPNYSLDGTPLAVRGIALRQVRTRGLAAGTLYSDLRELPSRTADAWGNPLETYTELTIADTFGFGDWEKEAAMCFGQEYPLPCSVLGLTYDLDTGG